MKAPVDVLVIGGGPAGCATAIWAAGHGLRVRLLERLAFPRHRPGETLHPGAESIFEHLGVAERVAAASELRHEGHTVSWSGREGFTPFGTGAEGRWRGYQILREQLDSLLLARAGELGVEASQSETVAEPIVSGGRVIGVKAGGASIAARHVVDAAGSRGWLRRRLSLLATTASPPLRAYYGYCEGGCDETDAVPSLVGDAHGWTWTAQVAPGRLNWTRLAFDADERPVEPPPRLRARRPLGRVRGADVTWRHVPASAGPGYFLAGDAAAVVDPAASHGVLRALMSGMMAAHAIARIRSGWIREADAIAGYRTWTATSFEHDVGRLSELYRQLDPEGELPWPRR